MSNTDILSVASEVPYVEYVAKAWKIFSSILGIGKQADPAKAIQELQRQLAELARRVDQLERRVAELDVQLKQTQNLARIRLIRQCHDEAANLAFQLSRTPDVDELATIAHAAGSLALRMFDDGDVWLWSDMRPLHPSPKNGPRYELLPAEFKGLPLTTFAFAVTVFALAAALHIARQRTARAGYDAMLTRLREAAAIRPAWVDLEVPPYTLPEQFRAQITVSPLATTKYVTNGQCAYDLECSNRIERKSFIVRRGITIDAPAGTPHNTLCSAPPNLGILDETEIEDKYPPIQILAGLEEMLTRLHTSGSLADPPPTPLFNDETRAVLTLYAIDRAGQIHQFTCTTTTYLRSPAWRQSGPLGSGLVGFSDIAAGYHNVLYAAREDGSIWWYRNDAADTNAPRWTGPRQVAAPPATLGHIVDSYVAGISGEIFTVGRGVLGSGGGLGARVKIELAVRRHSGYQAGEGEFSAPVTLSHDWARYKAVFGGERVIYGLTEDGRLMWHRATLATGTGKWRLDGPKEIGSGWNIYTRVFSDGKGFIFGIHPNGQMKAYHYKTWQYGPTPGKHPWTPAIPIPGVNWNAYPVIIPMPDKPGKYVG